MKQISLVLTLMLCVSWAMAQSAVAAKNEVAFSDVNMDKAYKDYLQLKDALVASSTEAAKTAAAKLKIALASVKDSKAAIAAAEKVAGSSRLDDVRMAFSSLTTAMTSLVKREQLTRGILYIEYCPMANDNTGAYWLSSEKEIKNPYFGDKMLRCGSVKEMIQ